MSITDPIADMATQIRNASSAGKENLDVRASKINEGILEILKSEGFIENYKRIPDNKQDALRIYLKFTEDRRPIITKIKRISKPGLRVYKRKDEITEVLGGLGIAVVSTSQGFLSDKETRERGLGGEVIMEVW